MQPVKGVDISEFNWVHKPVDFPALEKVPNGARYDNRKEVT